MSVCLGPVIVPSGYSDSLSSLNIESAIAAAADNNTASDPTAEKGRPCMGSESLRQEFASFGSASFTGLALLHRLLCVFGLLDRNPDQRLWQLRLTARLR